VVGVSELFEFIMAAVCLFRGSGFGGRLMVGVAGWVGCPMGKLIFVTFGGC
jgi:hypothetical protein